MVRVQPISNLEIIQLLGFVDTCTSSNLGSFSHFLLQIVSLPLFILFFGDSHNTYIGPLMLSYKSPRFYSLFFILFFLLFRLNNFSCTFFRFTASFFRLFSIAHQGQQTRRLGCSKLSSLPWKHQEQNQKEKLHWPNIGALENSQRFTATKLTSNQDVWGKWLWVGTYNRPSMDTGVLVLSSPWSFHEQCLLLLPTWGPN